jgi:hypothetical protein
MGSVFDFIYSPPSNIDCPEERALEPFRLLVYTYYSLAEAPKVCSKKRLDGRIAINQHRVIPNNAS